MKAIIYEFEEKEVLDALLNVIEPPRGADPKLFVDGADEFYVEIRFTPRTPKERPNE